MPSITVSRMSTAAVTQPVQTTLKKESTRTLTNAFRKSNVSMVRADSITRRIDPEKVENLYPRKNDLTKFVGILRSNGTFGNSESNH